MLLLTIGIIILGLGGLATSYFWMKALKTYQENNSRLMDFIDKNIKERVVYTNQEYNNESKFSEGEEIVDEEDEIQELDSKQLKETYKHNQEED